MADQKLSQLTAATLPLAGTELAYVVQGGAERRTTAAAIAALAPAPPLVTTTAAGLVPSAWLTGAEAATLPHIHGGLAGVVYEHVRNASGAPMAALTPYHVIDSQGDTDRVLVVPANASDPATMPASGILATALDANEDGHGVIAGVPTGVNTVANPSGTVLYVGNGVLTPTAPATNIQAIAIVGRSHASTGTLSMLQSPSLGNAAYRNVGTTAGTVAAGDAPAAAISTHVAASDPHTQYLSKIPAPATLTYAATVDLNMTELAGAYRTITLAGNIAFTTSNRSAGEMVTLRIICDSTQRTLTFPAGWRFINAEKPTTIAASKVAVLSVMLFGTADTDAIAAYGVEP